MNVNESIRDWIEYQQQNFEEIADLPVYCMGETVTLSPPYVAIYESGIVPVEQNGSVLYGVGAYDVTVDLITVPADESEEGTPHSAEMLWRRQLNDIIADRAAIDWASGLNGMTIFDIRTTPPTTEAGDGVRRTTWNLAVIACPS